MLLTKKNLFRKYEGTLFHSDIGSPHDKMYGFYLLLRPQLNWVKESILEKGLTSNEAESELYIVCSAIYLGYDKTKSSIIPYLEKQIPWYISKMLKKIENSVCLDEVPAGLIDGGGSYEMKEEFYWKVPSILLEERYVGKCFTRSEKYVMYKILVSDRRHLSIQKLAKTCNIDRKTMKSILSDLKEVIQMEESNARKF